MLSRGIQNGAMTDQATGHWGAGRIETSELDSSVELVGLIGEHDLSTAQDLRRAFETARRNGRAIVVDLSNVTFVDSSIVAVLVEYGKQDGGDQAPAFVLWVPPSLDASVRRVLELTGLPDYIPSADTLDSAVGQVSGGG